MLVRFGISSTTTMLAYKLELAITTYLPLPKDIAHQFINLIVNQKRQFELDTKQKESLLYAIVNCPQEYRAIVKLAILAANFTTDKGLRALDEMIPQIGLHISNELGLEAQVEESLLKAESEIALLSRWLKEKLNSEKNNEAVRSQPVSYKNIAVKQPGAELSLGKNSSKNKPVKSSRQQNSISTRKKELLKKLNFVRDLIALLISKGESSAIPSRLNIILDAFAGSNQIQRLSSQLPNSEADLQYRVKAVAELFGLPNPTGTEAERLLLYGACVQISATKQINEIVDLKDSLRKEKELNHHKQEQPSMQRDAQPKAIALQLAQHPG